MLWLFPAGKEEEEGGVLALATAMLAAATTQPPVRKSASPSIRACAPWRRCMVGTSRRWKAFVSKARTTRERLTPSKRASHATMPLNVGTAPLGWSPRSTHSSTTVKVAAAGSKTLPRPWMATFVVARDTARSWTRRLLFLLLMVLLVSLLLLLIIRT